MVVDGGPCAMGLGLIPIERSDAAFLNALFKIGQELKKMKKNYSYFER